ncbi:MAG: hypothetical protein AABY15_07780, partial [Nanoarchaeota archaeon]
MPSVTIGQQNLLQEGAILEVLFLVPTKIEEDLKKEGKEVPKGIPAKALIDTGASSCSLKDSIPTSLGLTPVGTVTVKTPNSSNHQAYEYFMRMYIPALNLIYEDVFIAMPLEEQPI